MVGQRAPIAWLLVVVARLLVIRVVPLVLLAPLVLLVPLELLILLVLLASLALLALLVVFGHWPLAIEAFPPIARACHPLLCLVAGFPVDMSRLLHLVAGFLVGRPLRLRLIVDLLVFRACRLLLRLVVRFLVVRSSLLRLVGGFLIVGPQLPALLGLPTQVVIVALQLAVAALLPKHLALVLAKRLEPVVAITCSIVCDRGGGGSLDQVSDRGPGVSHDRNRAGHRSKDGHQGGSGNRGKDTV